MTGSASGTLHLPKAAGGLARAQRMLDDLKNYEYDRIGFTDRIPYVFDLLYGVTRMINEESAGKRTVAFSSWWKSLSVKLRQEITELRHAELKALESQTGRNIDVVIHDSIGVYRGRPANAGDTAVTITWVFSGGPLDQQPVLPVLEQYLKNLEPILTESENRLSRGP